MKKLFPLACFILFAILIFLKIAMVDPLPSWNDTHVKNNILTFVNDATNPSSHGYIAPEKRIAVFDNDGTLWQEQPTAEIAFLTTLIEHKISQDPSFAKQPAVDAVLNGDKSYLEKNPHDIYSLIQSVHEGMPVTEYQRLARHFLDTTRHPKLHKKYTDLTYKPMVELLNYLRANGFNIYICSGGSQDFMRIFAEQAYGVPPQNVIGLTKREKFIPHDRGGDILITGQIIYTNNQDEKPVGIWDRTGRTPVIVGGNVRSNGDIAMMQYGMNNPHSLQLMIVHDDPIREFKYTDSDSIQTSLKNNWNLVRMKSDWKIIFK